MNYTIGDTNITILECEVDNWRVDEHIVYLLVHYQTKDGLFSYLNLSLLFKEDWIEYEENAYGWQEKLTDLSVTTSELDAFVLFLVTHPSFASAIYDMIFCTKELEDEEESFLNQIQEMLERNDLMVRTTEWYRKKINTLRLPSLFE